MPLCFAKGKRPGCKIHPSNTTNYRPSYANNGIYLIICSNLTFISCEDRIHDKEELEILDPLQCITVLPFHWLQKEQKKSAGTWYCSRGKQKETEVWICLKVIKEKRIGYFPGIFRHFCLFWKAVIKVALITCLWSMNSALYLQSKSLDCPSLQGDQNTVSWKHFLEKALFSQYSLLKRHHFFTKLCGGGLPTSGFISLWDWRCICSDGPGSHNLKAAWAVLDRNVLWGWCVDWLCPSLTHTHRVSNSFYRLILLAFLHFC